MIESNSSVIATSGKAKVALLFAVKDTGIGISKDQIELLFKPFSQAESATTPKYGGTGLGLAICDRLVVLMDGEIWVESKLGEGSTFFFTIQTNVADIPQESPQVSRQKTLKLDSKLCERLPLVILVAEDNPINQEFALAMLGKMGYKVDIVDNGREAIAAIQKREYNILLLDVQMPVMDGLETASYLVNNWHKLDLAYPRPKIIAMTASTYQDDREKCFEAGMDDYISKPIAIDVMQRMLEKWGRNRETASEREDNYISSIAIIDNAAIQLIREINPDLLKRMVRLFLEEEAPKLLNQFGQSLQELNLEEIGIIAHSVKGSSRVLGAAGLANLCEQIELKVKKNESHGLDGLLQQVEDTYQQVQQELSKLL
jgi:CheY-like chemotaxis protein/HPt (histidine-containing phosphotransfer) domain-containing protein